MDPVMNAKDDADKTATRVYRSTLRTEQAAATRRRVLEAAAECFAERGYAGTSLAEIAARAGVSLETVKANGPKRGLLLGAFEQAFAGTEGQPVSDSDLGTALRDIPDPGEYLAIVARFIAAANARTSVLWTEFLSAANADDHIAAELDGLLARRRNEYRALAGLLAERGIGQGGEADAAALSFLWSPEGHQQLVLQSGWPLPDYEQWLIDAAQRQLIP